MYKIALIKPKVNKMWKIFKEIWEQEDKENQLKKILSRKFNQLKLRFNKIHFFWKVCRINLIWMRLTKIKSLFLINQKKIQVVQNQTKKKAVKILKMKKVSIWSKFTNYNK